MMSTTSDKRKLKAVELASRYAPAGGRILEVSCGAGKALQLLKRKGFEVVGTNYSRYDGESQEIDIRHGVDIVQGLPFEGGSFDTVMFLDVIEHLADHEQALSELSRVCRPGGHMIIITPNMLRLTSRLHFLLTGFFKLKRPFIGFDVPIESAFGFHNYPVHPPVLLYQFRARGFFLEAFTASGYKPRSFLLFALLWPFIALGTWLKVHVQEKNLKGRPSASQLSRCLTSLPGLCGEFIAVVARKGEAGEQGPAVRKTRLPKWSKKWESREPSGS